MAPKSLLGASWRLLALSWRLSALSWRLLAASWRSWGLLGASWAALGAISSSNIKPGYHGTGSALEARAASTASGEQQSRKASRKHSRQASRARSAPPLSVLSWGFAWDASRAGGLHGSLQTKKKVLKTALKCHPGGSKIAPKSLQNGSRRPPGAPPRAETQVVTFFAPFLGLLGGSWGAPGALLAAPGAVLAPLGPLLAPPGALLGGMLASLGSPFGAFWASF